MKVFGLDFTSSPKKGKPLTLAKCKLQGQSLTVEELYEFGNEAVSPLEDYANWLSGAEDWANEDEWIAGIDFPFGMPLAAIARFSWANVSASATWQDYVRELFVTHKTLADFEKSIKDWSYPNEISEAGNPIKIQSKRLTDQVAHAQSPMKVSDNPHVGKMFFRGCKSILDSGVHIPTLRPSSNDQCHRIAVEAYPRLVAQRFIPDQPAFDEIVTTKRERMSERKALDKSETEQLANLKAEIRGLSATAKLSLRYKEAGASEVAQNNRRRIVEALSKSDNPYGVQLCFKQDADRTDCIADQKADTLDSILCAVQAAWSYGLREEGYGIPRFGHHDLLRQQVALEGWIVDPAMLSVFGGTV